MPTNKSNLITLAGWLLIGIAAWKMGWIGGGGILPAPSTAPFPTDKLSVLIVEETEDRIKLPRQQLAAITGTQWKAIVPTGQWRVLDQHVTLSTESQWVKDALAVKRDSVPWLLISDGKAGFSGPMPENEADLIELLKKYGGA